MTILSPFTSNPLQNPEQIKVFDSWETWTESVNSQIPWKPSDRILEEAIGKIINLDEIVNRLHNVDFHNCAPYTAQQLKFAFLKWIENHLESIEQQPEYFLKESAKHFDKHLPEIDDFYFQEQDDLDFFHEQIVEKWHQAKAAQAAQKEVEEAFSPWDEIESDYDPELHFEAMFKHMEPALYHQWLKANEAALRAKYPVRFVKEASEVDSFEDDFDGTPQQSAQEALNW